MFYAVKSPMLKASADSIALLPMGASQATPELYNSPTNRLGEGSGNDGAHSDSDSLLDTFDLEAQMAQERLGRRAKQMRAQSSLLLQLPSRAADVGRACQKGGTAIKNHLNVHGFEYAVAICLITLAGFTLTGIIKLMGAIIHDNSPPPQPDGASASTLGAQITVTLSRL